MLVSPGKEEHPCYSLSAICWHLTRATVCPGTVWVRCGDIVGAQPEGMVRMGSLCSFSPALPGPHRAGGAQQRLEDGTELVPP